MVLRVLSRAPFEPLHKASLHCLAFKSVVLVAFASGPRISMLLVLSVVPGHFRWKPAGVRLVPRPDFFAKNQSPSSQSFEIFLPSLSSFSSWALFNGASLKDFQQAAYWSSPNTFISCYLKDVLTAEASFASAVLKSSAGSRGAGATPRVPGVSL